MIRSTFLRKLQSKFTHCHLLWLRRRATGGNLSSPVIVLLLEQWQDKSPRQEVNADPPVSAGRWLCYRTELKCFSCNNIISCQGVLGESCLQEARTYVSRRVSSFFSAKSSLKPVELELDVFKLRRKAFSWLMWSNSWLPKGMRANSTCWFLQLEAWTGV